MTRLFIGTALAVAVATITPVVSRTLRGQAPRSGGLPRMADGKPDLHGVWQVVNSAAWDIEDHLAKKGVPAGQSVVDGGDLPYQPWAVAKRKENGEKQVTSDPETECYLPGVP